ncbi:MAG: hypothetical protein ABJB61_10035 [bacterium]
MPTAGIASAALADPQADAQKDRQHDIIGNSSLDISGIKLPFAR